MLPIALYTRRGSLVDSGGKALESPVDFLRDVSSNVADNARFFISYVSVSGGLQVFFRLSQLHNLTIYWFVTSVLKEDATSERRIDHLETNVKVGEERQIVVVP